MAKEYEQLVAELKNGVIRELAEECRKSKKEAKEITRNIRLPSGETSMKFDCDGDTVQITMSMEGVGYKRPPQRGKKKPSFINMQADDAAFEGWALALHVHLNKNIQLELDTNGEAVPAWDREKPHYNRFLYRLKKFDTLYSWFSIGEKLGKVVEDFGRYLFESGVTFYNNIAGSAAGIRGGRKKPSEAWVEATFEDNSDLLRAYSKNLFRQLPVGLFAVAGKEKIGVFTGRKSAIDLWGLNDDASGTQLAIYELKLQNKQVGIISELMFYANYTYDMFVGKSFEHSQLPERNEDFRGYEQLANANITGIRAYMLTDKLHPLITPNVLKEMNRRSIHNALTYDALKYEWEENNGNIVIKGVESWF